MRSAKLKIGQGSLSFSFSLWTYLFLKWVRVLGCCVYVWPCALCSFLRTFNHFLHFFPAYKRPRVIALRLLAVAVVVVAKRGAVGCGW